METKNLEKIKLKRGIAERGWNKHLPVPLLPEESVYVHPDQHGLNEKNFIRIIHSDGKNISVFSKEHFE